MSQPNRSAARGGASCQCVAGQCQHPESCRKVSVEREACSGALPFDDCAGVPKHVPAVSPSGPSGNVPGSPGFVERRNRRDDRRDGQSATYFDAEGFERRRGPGRRLSDFTKAAEEGNLTKEQFLFIMAIETFKRSNQIQYPSWTDVLEVLRLLGYRKTMASEIRINAAEDWTELGMVPSNVRPPRWAEHTQRVKQRGGSDPLAA